MHRFLISDKSKACVIDYQKKMKLKTFKKFPEKFLFASVQLCAPEFAEDKYALPGVYELWLLRKDKPELCVWCRYATLLFGLCFVEQKTQCDTRWSATSWCDKEQ